MRASWTRRESTGALLLFAATTLALIAANGPWRDAYHSLREWSAGPASLHLHLSVETWIRDGLLAVFFFLAGLELKRELAIGDLRSWRAASYPVLIAACGVLAPIAVTLLALRGIDLGGSAVWAIPTATDIAFALGVLALAGAGLPARFRLTLLALAVVDDVFAIALIAVLFADDLDLRWLAVSVTCIAVYAAAQRSNVRGWPIYVAIGVVAWAAMHASGVHATVAGIALGAATRARPRSSTTVVEQAPVARLEHLLTPWVAVVVLPLFAFVSAGVPLDAAALRDALGDRIAIAVFLGLLLGKWIGITLGSALLHVAGLSERDGGPTTPFASALGFLGGIGFTVSLLITQLALDGAVRDRVTVAVLAASLAAAVAAAVQLAWLRRAAV